MLVACSCSRIVRFQWCAVTSYPCALRIEGTFASGLGARTNSEWSLFQVFSDKGETMNANGGNVLLDAVEIAGISITLYVGAVGSAVAIWSAIDAVRLRTTVRERVPSLTLHSGRARNTATSPASSISLRDAA